MALSWDAAQGISLSFSNHKCFGDEPQGFEEIKPINIIVGRNNSGKSSLLDLIEYACGLPDPALAAAKREGRGGKQTDIFVEQSLGQEELMKVFRSNTSGGAIDGNHWAFGKRLIGKKIRLSLLDDGSFESLTTREELGIRHESDFVTNLAKKSPNYFKGLAVRRISAERNIQPEQPVDNPVRLGSDGTGLINLYRIYLTKAIRPRNVVERDILNDLNEIVNPDAKFTRILIQQQEDSKWELFLEEDNKGLVRLSHSGTGIKTILFALAYFHLLPHHEGKKVSDYAFLFEELENNLHPALQRRLHQYIRRKCKEAGCYFFLTTHSSVSIDIYSHDEMAQIIHVTHDGKSAKAEKATTYLANKGILDDLDIRASDLLQANGIVWIEGPSDRLYFNRWMELFSDGKIKEGIHYQCVFYGGRLLAHLSASEPDEDIPDLIQILRINRNAIMLIDSDKEREEDLINSTKKRLISEIAAFGGLAWVTQGREIENYMPIDVIRSLYPTAKKSLSQYQKMEKYLDGVEDGAGKKFAKQKSIFAERFLAAMTKENLTGHLDIDLRMKECMALISKWNKVPAS